MSELRARPPSPTVLLLTLAILGGACTKTDDPGSVAQHDPMPLHPTTGTHAALAIRVVWFPGGVDYEVPPKPLAFAAWMDGTIVWDDAALSADPHAYRTTRADPAQIRSLVDRVRARFESLPQRVTSHSFHPDHGYHFQEVSLEDNGAYFELTWGGEKDPENYARLAPVWKDIRMLVDAAIPTQGDVIAFDPGR